MSTTSRAPAAERQADGTRAGWWWCMLSGALLAVAYAPLLLRYAKQLWELPHYQFFPIAIAAAAYLTVVRTRSLSTIRPGNRWFTAAGWFAALGLLAVAVVLNSPLVAAISALMALAAAAYGFGGEPLLRAMLPGWALLWLTIRPPLNTDLALIGWMQQTTARSASNVLDLFGVVHVLAGNIVEVSGRQLLVEEACSGIHSLFSALACTLFYIFWVRRRWPSALLLLLSVPFWVMLANTGRVVLVTALRARWNIAADEGILHEMLGTAIFLVAMVLILSTDRLMLFLAPRLQVVGAAAADNAQLPALPDVRQTWMFWYSPMLACALLVVMQGAMFARTERPAKPAVPMRAALEQLDEASLPAELAGWQQMHFTTEQRDVVSIFGEFSRSWQYAHANYRGVISLDYPFSGWHPLPVCYLSHGWHIDRRTVKTEAGVQRMCAWLSKEDQGRYAYVEFVVFDDRLQSLEPQLDEVSELADRVDERLERWRVLLSGQPVPPYLTPTTYQFQFFVESYTPLDETAGEEFDAVFLTAWQKLVEHWRAAQEAS